MITQINKTMTELNFPCDWRIQWFQREKKLEIFLMYTIEKQPQLHTNDKYGKTNTDDTFVFEDGILIYNPLFEPFDDRHYLVTLPFDHESGMTGGLIEAFCKTLRFVAAEGHVNLKEFINSEDVKQFELVWQQENFESTIKTLQETGRFDATIFSYPTGKKESKV